MDPVLTYRRENGHDVPLLLWRLSPPSLAISSGPLGGGIGIRYWVINATVPMSYRRDDPDVHLGELADQLDLDGPGVGLLTGVDVADLVTTVDEGVTVWATVGLGATIWAAAPAPAPASAALPLPLPLPPRPTAAPVSVPPAPAPAAAPAFAPPAPASAALAPPPAFAPPAPASAALAPAPAAAPASAPPAPVSAQPAAEETIVGTVNILVHVPVRLSEAALVNAVATVAEAKAQALWELGLTATGTATDATCVICPTGGQPAAYGGPRSTWGARIARAVHRAVLSGGASRPWDGGLGHHRPDEAGQS